MPQFAKRLFGKLISDKGYLLHPLLKQLHEQCGSELIMPHRKNMKQSELELFDKLLLRKRAIVETIIDQLKNISQLEHIRHRFPINFLVNFICSSIAYCHQQLHHIDYLASRSLFTC